MDYTAHYEKSARMWSQGLHAHDFYEIYIHLEGGHLYCIEDSIYELQPNQMLIIPPLHMHGLVCDRDLIDYERCFLYLSPEMLQRFGLGKIDLTGIFERSYDSHNALIHLNREEAKLCKQHMQTIEKISGHSSVREQMDSFSRIMQILQIVEKHLASPEKTSAIKSTDNQIVEILQYINEHYTESISVETISQHFHISESSLAHRFRDYVNKSIYEYILYKRVVHAKELMFSDFSLTEIAFKCGFSDYSNFLRVFKKNTGMSPKEYRSGKLSN